MARTAAPVELTKTERARLRALVRDRSTPPRVLRRARIVLGAADGQKIRDLAAALMVSCNTVCRVRQRVLMRRLDALPHARNHKPPYKYGPKTEERILAALESPPPQGCAHWTNSLLVAHLRDVSYMYAWRVLHREGICLPRSPM